MAEAPVEKSLAMERLEKLFAKRTIPTWLIPSVPDTVKIQADVVKGVCDWLLSGFERPEGVNPVGFKVFYRIPEGGVGERKPADLLEAIEMGVKIFDAMIYFSATDTQRGQMLFHGVTDEDLLSPRDNRTMANAFTYQMLLIVTRGAPSEFEPTSERPLMVGHDVPRFVYEYMKMTDSPKSYARILTNNKIKDIDWSWLKDYHIPTIDETVEKRFSMISVGKRWAGPFGDMTVAEIDRLKPELRGPAAFAKRLYDFAPNWDYHPLTMDRDARRLLGAFSQNMQSF